MSIPDQRTDEILDSDGTDELIPLGVFRIESESWAKVDGALVIFDLDDPPRWLPERDEDGNSIPSLAFCDRCKKSAPSRVLCYGCVPEQNSLLESWAHEGAPDE